MSVDYNLCYLLQHNQQSCFFISWHFIHFIVLICIFYFWTVGILLGKALSGCTHFITFISNNTQRKLNKRTFRDFTSILNRRNSKSLKQKPTRNNDIDMLRMRVMDERFQRYEVMDTCRSYCRALGAQAPPVLFASLLKICFLMYMLLEHC